MKLNLTNIGLIAGALGVFYMLWRGEQANYENLQTPVNTQYDSQYNSTFARKAIMV